MLHIKEATKHFGKFTVLNNISLIVQPQSTIGIAGPSGSGKSTLLRCIQGLELLDSGSIHYTEKSGFMFQDFQLFPHMTVLKNLTYAPTLKNKNKCHDEYARQLLDQLGISDKIGSYPHQLSGGQKQRVALARCLMMQPDLLLCDEPTSGLDKIRIDDVMTLLNTIKAMGVTLIIASHDIDFLKKMSDKIIILKKGELITTVETDELKQYYQE